MHEATCPVCLSNQQAIWPHRKLELTLCRKCDLLYQLSNTIDDDVQYGSDYYDYQGLDRFFQEVRRLKVLTSLEYLKLLSKYLSVADPRLLDVGCAHGFMLEAAKSKGFKPVGVEVSPAAQVAKKTGFEVFQGDLLQSAFKPASFDAVTMIDVIEHFPKPMPIMERIHELLNSSGVLLIVTPDIFSLSRRIMGDAWFHYKKEHVCYYSPSSMRTLLEQSKFRLRHASTGSKYLSIQYVQGHFSRYGSSQIGRIMRIIGESLPFGWYTVPLKFPTGSIYVACKGN